MESSKDYLLKRNNIQITDELNKIKIDNYDNNHLNIGDNNDDDNDNNDDHKLYPSNFLQSEFIQSQRQYEYHNKFNKNTRLSNNMRNMINDKHNDDIMISMSSLYDGGDLSGMDNDNYNTINFDCESKKSSIVFEDDDDDERNYGDINKFDFTRNSNNISTGETMENISNKYISNNFMENCSYKHAPENPFENNQYVNNSLYFTDGIRSVDFVLVWSNDINEQLEKSKSNSGKRQIFEENLINQGLEIERESIAELHFVKIHAPLEVLRRYSEILKLRMPMKESLCTVHTKAQLSRLASVAQNFTQKIPGFNSARNTTSSVFKRLKGTWATIVKKFLVDENHFQKKSQRFTAVYSRDKEYLFDLEQACFFTAAVRSRIVQFILDRQRFTITTNEDFSFGIDRLVSEGAYIAAYPLHDGEVNVPGSMRNLLYTEWASISKWYRYQPLDYIKEYFGVKIGLYFAWLGYYTYMLLLASIVGVLCFIYSWVTLDKNIPSKDICSSEQEIKMCPLCDHWCDYWDLRETCVYARVTYLIDNSTTVFFAIFMSFWATLFLELWKRYSAEITHRWDLTGFDVREEHPRPQYLARLAHVKKIRIDYVTNTKEPEPPFWRMKLPATLFSFSVVILLVMMAFAAVVAVVLYRMSVMAALSVHGELTTSTALLFTTATAACINLCLIFVFNYIYQYLAEYLTEMELLRTQTEFDDSLILKIYLLQFVNYYASIFYIAFFKGKFIGHPGDYNRLFNYRQEECGFGGCLMELCIQLAVIMVGKQAMNTILEMIMPIFYKWLNVMRVRWFNKNRNISFKGKGERWLRDLKLIEWGPRGLFPEYLEMILQYGFVTIFVAAFPLAPFFALINNILEMRLDGKKLLTYYRRPVSQRVRDIGVWYRILDSIGKLSVITNGFIIAFTSDFIPRLVYRTAISPDGSLNGYLNFSLAYFNTNDLQGLSDSLKLSLNNGTLCRYPDFREPPWSPNRYQRTTMYWIIFACRLAFIVIFENIVALVMIIVRWCIPDMSSELRDQIRREAYITNEIIIRQETLRARAERAEKERSESRNDPVETTMNFIRMEKLMSGKLSQSELDLVLHAPGDPTAISSGCCPSELRKSKTNRNNNDSTPTVIQAEVTTTTDTSLSM